MHENVSAHEHTPQVLLYDKRNGDGDSIDTLL